jgi:hypothetical protein
MAEPKQRASRERGAIKSVGQAPGSVLTFSAVKEEKWRKKVQDPGAFRARHI